MNEKKVSDGGSDTTTTTTTRTVDDSNFSSVDFVSGGRQRDAMMDLMEFSS